MLWILQKDCFSFSQINLCPTIYTYTLLYEIKWKYQQHFYHLLFKLLIINECSLKKGPTCKSFSILQLGWTKKERQYMTQ